MSFKINYNLREEEEKGMNEPGIWLMSLVNGGTRSKDSLYQVIANPKTKKADDKFIHYISDKGHVAKIGKLKWRTFKKATEEEILKWKS